MSAIVILNASWHVQTITCGTSYKLEFAINAVFFLEYFWHSKLPPPNGHVVVLFSAHVKGARNDSSLTNSIWVRSTKVQTVNGMQPMLTLELHNLQKATLRRTLTPRNKPLTKGAKAFLINIAYSPVRGIKNLRRLFKVGVMTIHKSALATAMILHALQLGCSFVFYWKLLWRVNDFTLSEVGGSESTSGHVPQDHQIVCRPVRACGALWQRQHKTHGNEVSSSETRWSQVCPSETKREQVNPSESKCEQVRHHFPQSLLSSFRWP